MKTLLRLSRLIFPLIPVMLVAVLFGTLGHLCAIGIPVLGAIALNGTIPLYVLLIIGVCRGVLHYIEQYCNHFLAFSVLATIRQKVFNKLRSLGPAKLDGKDKGDIIALLTSDIELLEVFYAHTLSPFFIAILVTATMLVFFVNISWQLALVALGGYIFVGILIPNIVKGGAQKHATIYRKEFASMNSFLLDSLRGLQQSILYNNGNTKLEEIKSGSDKLSLSKKRLSVNEGFTSALTGFGVTFSGLVMLAVSLSLYNKGIIDINQVIVATVAMFSSFGPVIAIAALGNGLSGTIASGKRVISLLDEEPITEEISNGTDISYEGAKVNNVSFTYPANPEELVLDNVSMELDKNKIIGIKGKSGSGKSTLLKLLMYFWKTDKGEITISNTDINTINTQSLRQSQSFITQETVLFHDTILNNIKVAKQDATFEEIQEACKKACIHDLIMELPKGYETQVAELGDNFSGGERQRLGLARAFLHNGQFMLLDEPTSNLDSYNEHKIMEAVKKESDGKTVVIVSHRDSTFEYADKIYSIVTGRIS